MSKILLTKTKRVQQGRKIQLTVLKISEMWAFTAREVKKKAKAPDRVKMVKDRQLQMSTFFKVREISALTLRSFRELIFKRQIDQRVIH